MKFYIDSRGYRELGRVRRGERDLTALSVWGEPIFDTSHAIDIKVSKYKKTFTQGWMRRFRKARIGFWKILREEWDD